MLCVVHSGLDGGDIAAQVDGGGRCQIGAVGSVAGLIHSAGLQLLDGLADREVAQRLGLSIPLGNCAAPGDHAVVLAQFVLGQNFGGEVSGDDAVCVKLNRCADGVQTGGVDDALIVHQNGGQSHIVLCCALSLFGDGSALTHAGDHSQAGLQCALFQDGLSFLGGPFHHDDGAHAASQQGHDQQADDNEHQVFLHNEFLHDRKILSCRFRSKTV